MKYLFVGLLCLLPLSAHAAITCTGTSFPFDVPTDPQSQDYTVPSVTNGVTFVHVAVRNGSRTLTSLTIGGASMTQVGSVLSTTNTAAELFYSVGLTSGVKSIAANWDATPLTYILTAVTCEGVDQTSPIPITNTATGNSTGVTVDCASTTANQLVIDFFGASGGATWTIGAGQTTIDQDTADGVFVAGSTTEPGGGTITMSHAVTSGNWTTYCLALAEASGRTNKSAGYLP